MATKTKAPTKRPETEFDRVIAIAKEDANDLVQSIRRAIKTEDPAAARQVLRIAKHCTEEAVESIDRAVLALPPTPIWITAKRVQEARDMGWEFGVIAYDPITYGNPVFHSTSETVDPSLAWLAIYDEHHKRPGSLYRDEDKEQEMHSIEICLRREAEKKRKES